MYIVLSLNCRLCISQFQEVILMKVITWFTLKKLFDPPLFRHDRDRDHERDHKPRSYFSRSAHEEVKNEMRAAEERLQGQWPTSADAKTEKIPSQAPQGAPQQQSSQQVPAHPMLPQQQQPPQSK